MMGWLYIQERLLVVRWSASTRKIFDIAEELYKKNFAKAQNQISAIQPPVDLALSLPCHASLPPKKDASTSDTPHSLSEVCTSKKKKEFLPRVGSNHEPLDRR